MIDGFSDIDAAKMQLKRKENAEKRRRNPARRVNLLRSKRTTQ